MLQGASGCRAAPSAVQGLSGAGGVLHRRCDCSGRLSGPGTPACRHHVPAGFRRPGALTCIRYVCLGWRMVLDALALRPACRGITSERVATILACPVYGSADPAARSVTACCSAGGSTGVPRSQPHSCSGHRHSRQLCVPRLCAAAWLCRLLLAAAASAAIQSTRRCGELGKPLS